MNDPVTAIDPRFSDPDADATAWNETERVLESAELFWITDGPRATAVPMSRRSLPCGWTAHCTSPPAPREQKALNLQHNPHVILTTGCNTWEIGPRCRFRRRRAVRSPTNALLERLAAAWANEVGRTLAIPSSRGGSFEHEAGEALVYAVSPTKVLAFGKGRFSHTRHRFADTV